MKKTIVCMLVAVMLVLSSVSLLAYDESHLTSMEFPQESDIGSLVAKNNTPTIDGSISADEGWSDAKYIDYTNMPHMWGSSSRCIITGNIYFAWDSEALYVAADITDPTQVLSTALDEPNDNGVIESGYNGDVFTIGIDPMGICLDEGMGHDYATMYNMSLMENGSFKVYRSQFNDGDITDSVKGAAKTTANGWVLECMIPWEMIIDDTMVASLGDIQVSADEITALGTVSNVCVIYMDRAVYTEDVAVFKDSGVDAAEGDVFTLSRNISIPLVHNDGMGWGDGGSEIRSFGLKLAMGDSTGYAPVVEDPADDPAEEPTDDPAEDPTEEPTEDPTEEPTEEPADEPEEEPADEPEEEPADEPEPETTTASAVTTAANADSGEGGNTGLIIGIVAAVVVVVAAVVVIVIKKKK